MYGIVNRAIKGLILDKAGVEKWTAVKEVSGVDIDVFLSNKSYDDDITFKLAKATAQVLDLSVTEVFVAFGEYWILHTGLQEYGSLMEAGGKNFKDFMVNLPNFHSRIMLMFPDLTPPEFRISDIQDNLLHVHYYSDREGLQDFVIGLLQGIGKMFDTPVSVKMIKGKAAGHDHVVFSVKWQ